MDTRVEYLMAIMESLAEKDETVGHLYVIAKSLFEDASQVETNPAENQMVAAAAADIPSDGMPGAQVPTEMPTAPDGTAAIPATGSDAQDPTQPAATTAAPADAGTPTADTAAVPAAPQDAPMQPAATPDTSVTPTAGAEAPANVGANPERKAELIAFAKDFKQYKDMINADGTLKAEAPNEARAMVEKAKVNNPTMVAILQAYNKSI